MHPDKTAGYAVAIFYLPLAVMAVANAINTIAVCMCFVGRRGLVMYVGDLTCPPYTKHVTTQAFLLHQREERRQRAEVLKLVKSWEMLGSMDRDQDGEVRCVCCCGSVSLVGLVRFVLACIMLIYLKTYTGQPVGLSVVSAPAVGAGGRPYAAFDRGALRGAGRGRGRDLEARAFQSAAAGPWWRGERRGQRRKLSAVWMRLCVVGG